MKRSVAIGFALICGLVFGDMGASAVGPGVRAQADKDPQRDISVSFAIEPQGGGKGAGQVFGRVTNRSANVYPCVRIEFDLFTRFDLRPRGQGARHLGVLSVEVQDLQPRSVQNYRQQLPFPAGIGLKSVSECTALPGRTQPGVARPTTAPGVIALPTKTPFVPTLKAGRYTIRQKSTERYVDAYVDRNDSALMTRPYADYVPRFGNLVDLPVWLITPVGGNRYTIQQAETGRFMDAHEIAERDFAVVTRPAQNNATQIWILRSAGDGIFTMQQQSSGRFLDGYETKPKDYRLVTRPGQNVETQQWIVWEFFPEG